MQLYKLSDLEKINGRSVYEMVRDGIQFDILERLADDPSTVTVTMPSVEGMLKLKNVMEYKWFLPIHYRWKYKQLVFHGYSAHLLLKLIEPYQRFHQRKRRQFEAILDDTADCCTMAYAAGAIENAPDKGRGYREDLKKALEFTKVKVVSPCDFEYNICGSGQKTLQEHDVEADLVESYTHTRQVLEGDCAAVVETEAVIALLDQYIGTGTKSELTVAVAFKRPVYAIVADGMDLKDITPWTRACPSRYFHSMDALVHFVKQSEI